MGFSSCGHTDLLAPWYVGSSWTRDWTCVPCVGRQILNQWTTREVPGKSLAWLIDAVCPRANGIWVNSRAKSVPSQSETTYTQKDCSQDEKRSQRTCTQFYFIFFPFIFISWRLITLQYCSGFCHTLTWISHGFTCIPHPDPPSHLPAHNCKRQAGRIISEHHCPAADCIPLWCPTSFTWPPWSLPHLWVYMCPP